MPVISAWPNYNNMLSIDLNCDMCEGIGNDVALMPFITSANIACGFHAGDAATMKATVEPATSHHVAIGAHPGFPGKQNFGRTEMKFSPEEIYKLKYDQVTALQVVCTALNTRFHHIKPHGALYNMAAAQPALAHAMAWAVYDIDKQLILYGLRGATW